MDAHQRLAARVAGEQGDILGTMQLVLHDPELQDRLFDQLVDLLVEGMFLDLREGVVAGTIDRDEYAAAITELADRCRETGLLPLPSRHV